MLAWLFARRYLVSRKSHSVINIISGVSAFTLAVPVAAMVILLSIFNGFEGLVKGMYTEFDPDIMVSAVRGKTFEADSLLDARLRGVDGVSRCSYVVEDNALVEYRGGQYIATLRGVDSLYGTVVPIARMVNSGQYALQFGDIEQAVVGQGMAYNLGVNIAMYDYIRLYAPRRGSFSSALPLESYRSGDLLPAATFALDAETDSKYLIAPIEFARRLFDYPGRATGIAVKLAQGVDADKAAAKIQQALGGDFKALTRYQQKASLYKIMRYEKWGIFMISVLVLLIASFSIIGSLVMLVIDKKNDLRTMITLGGTVGFLRGVFIREGMLIAGAGAVLGMVVGVGFCLLQHYFGLITISAQTFLVDSYPVVLQWGDLMLVAGVFLIVSYVIVYLTVGRMIPKSMIRL